MASADRVLPLCDLLLAAAYADDHLDDREAERVQELLAYMHEGALPQDVEARIESFDPKAFDLEATAALFRGDPATDREHLLSLVAAVHDADDNLDLSEDEFLTSLAAALDLPASALGGLTIKVEVEEVRTRFRKASIPPPLPPGAKKS